MELPKKKDASELTSSPSQMLFSFLMNSLKRKKVLRMEKTGIARPFREELKPLLTKSSEKIFAISRMTNSVKNFFISLYLKSLR